MSFFTSENDLNKLQSEAFDHLWNGRFRLALPLAEKIFQIRPDDSDAAICLAWALLENGNPAKAMEYANLAVELKGDSTKAKGYRAFLLSRMSIFEGAIADLDQSIEKQKETLAWSYLNKAKSLAGLGKFNEANQILDLAIIIDDGKHTAWKELSAWLEKAISLSKAKNILEDFSLSELKIDATNALRSKEYWYSLLVAKNILKQKTDDDAVLLELESMLYLFQIKPALRKAETLQSKFRNNDKFNNIFSSLIKFNELEQESELLSFKTRTDSSDRITRIPVDEPEIFRFDSQFYPNEYVDLFSLKVFDIDEEALNNNRIYCKQFDENTKRLGAEIIFNNPFYGQTEKHYKGRAIWYINDFEILKNNFQLNVRKDWDSVIYVQSLNGSGQKLKTGQGKVEIYINNFKIGEKYFSISETVITEETEQVTQSSIESVERKEEQKSEKIREPRKVRLLKNC